MKEGSNLELKVVEIGQYGSWQIVVLQVERRHRTQKYTNNIYVYIYM